MRHVKKQLKKQRKSYVREIVNAQTTLPFQDTDATASWVTEGTHTFPMVAKVCITP